MLIHFTLMRELMLQSSSIIKQIWFCKRISTEDNCDYTAQFSLLDIYSLLLSHILFIKMLHGDPTPQFCRGHSKKCLVLLKFLTSRGPNTLSFVLLAICFSCLMNSLWRKHGQWEGEPFNTPFTFTNWFLHSLLLSKYSISTKIYHNNRSSFRSY